jgi:hypothetical protein
MQIRKDSISFNSMDGSGPRSDTKDVIFTNPVTQAEAILTGFNAAFSPSDDDHHLGNLEIRLRAEIDTLAPTRVVVTAVFGLRDWSGEWDDRYEGTVNFAVIGE